MSLNAQRMGSIGEALRLRIYADKIKAAERRVTSTTFCLTAYQPV